MLWSFTGCENDPELSGENKITAFKIGDIEASIFEVDQQISITTLPADTDLKKLTPVVTVSSKASVSPGSGVEVDISGPVSYTVTAENGVTRTYLVKVSKLETGIPSVEIGWPDTADKQPVIYGLPEKTNSTDPDFTLSRGGKNGPKEIVISAGGRYEAVYDGDVLWYIDNSSTLYNGNIITIKAEDYTLTIPHRITFIGTKDGVEYSKTITFTVKQ
jgi:hypothetical protein